MKSIRIVSDGNPNSTRVYTSSGELLQGVAKVEIGPIGHGSEVVTAKVTFVLVELDVTAQQVDA